MCLASLNRVFPSGADLHGFHRIRVVALIKESEAAIMQSHHVLIFSACFPVICDLRVTHVDCLYRHLLYLHSVLLTVVNLTSAAQRSQNCTRGMSSAQTLLHLTPDLGKVSFKETSENQTRSNMVGGGGSKTQHRSLPSKPSRWRAVWEAVCGGSSCLPPPARLPAQGQPFTGMRCMGEVPASGHLT